MSNRHLGRTVAMQTLYEWDFNGKHNEALPPLLSRNMREFAPEFDDGGFTDGLIKGVLKNQPEIDQYITKYAPEWPLEQISVIDKSILRLAGYELLKDLDIPPKVAINEAIEIAKTFGGENSSKFINGVLGTLYRQSDRFVDEEDKPKIEPE